MKTKKQLQAALDKEVASALRWWSKLQRAVTAIRKSMARQRRLTRQLEQLDQQRKAERASRRQAPATED